MPYEYDPPNKFGYKDTLPEGDPEKIIKGSEFDEEFGKIAAEWLEAGGTISGELDIEREQRIAADDDLQNQIDVITSNDASGAIAAEEAARIAADAALQANIDAEAAARVAGDEALATQISGISTDGLVSQTTEEPQGVNSHFTFNPAPSGLPTGYLGGFFGVDASNQLAEFKGGYNILSGDPPMDAWLVDVDGSVVCRTGVTMGFPNVVSMVYGPFGMTGSEENAGGGWSFTWNRVSDHWELNGDLRVNGTLTDINGDPIGGGGGSGPEVEEGSQLGEMLTWRTDRWEQNPKLKQYGDATAGNLFDFMPYTSTGSGGTPADNNRRADFRVRSNEGDARLTAATQVGKASVEFFTGDDSLTKLAGIWSHTGSYGDFRAGELVFETGDAPRITIAADGKVGINQPRPTALLHVEGVNSQCAQFRGESYELINVNFGSGTAEFDIRNTTTFHIKRSGTSAIAIDGSANCTFSQNVTAPDFVATSDERVKDNISTAPIGLIDSLKGREWDWKESGERGSGVVAQELEQVLPHLVHTDDEGMKSVAYNGLIAYLIEEIKDLKAQVETLKNG